MEKLNLSEGTIDSLNDTYLTQVSDNIPLSLPTHIVVQRQLKDIILAQKAAVSRIQQELSTTVQEQFISKDAHEQIVREIEHERDEMYVSRDTFDALQTRLETEHAIHCQTQQDLISTSDQLECALSDIDVLKQQMEREKTAYEQSLMQMKVKTHKEISKKTNLQTKYSEIERQHHKQTAALEKSAKEVQVLKQKLNKQDKHHLNHMSEMSVRLEQEKYMTKTLDTRNSRRKP